MFQLKLHGQLCVSCGICMDVCAPRAIAMRAHRGARVEGNVPAGAGRQSGGNTEREPEPLMTFPYLARPEQCNGCGDCVRECPVNALEVFGS